MYLIVESSCSQHVGSVSLTLSFWKMPRWRHRAGTSSNLLYIWTKIATLSIVLRVNEHDTCYQKKSSLAFLLWIALNGDIFAGFRAAPRSAVMESAGEAKYFSDLVEAQAADEESFGQFLDCDARDQGRFFTHISSCFAAAGCSCSSARLNRSEISALTESVMEWQKSCRKPSSTT